MNNIFKQLESYATLSTAKRVGGMSAGTKVFLRKYLKLYMEETEEINREAFLMWLSNRTLSPSTKSTIAAMLGKFFHTFGYINAEDYSVLKKSFRSPSQHWSEKTLTKEMVIQLIKIAPKRTNRSLALRNQAMVALLATLGLRIGQLSTLKCTDLVFDNDKVVITIKIQKEKRKGLKEASAVRSIPADYTIGDFVPYMMLKELSQTKKSGYLFATNKGTPLSHRYIEEYISRLGEAKKIQVTPHYFRHYVGTEVANKYGLLSAQLLLGHQDSKTTSRYIAPSAIDISNTLP